MTWYRLKLTVEQKGESAVVRGKVWPRNDAEPAAWNLEVTDPKPNREGTPPSMVMRPAPSPR